MTNIWDKTKEFFKKVNSWIRKDGWLHIAVSAVIAFTTAIFMKLLGDIGAMFAIPFFLTLVIGIGKEVYDSWRKQESIEWHDIYCDLIGIGIGEILILLILL